MSTNKDKPKDKRPPNTPPAASNPSGQEGSNKPPETVEVKVPETTKVTQETVTAVFIRQYTIDDQTYHPARTERKPVRGAGRTKLVEKPADRADLTMPFFKALQDKGVVISEADYPTWLHKQQNPGGDA